MGLLLVLGVCAPTAARAQPRDPIDLEWTAPAECPRIESVRARLRKLAGPLKSTGNTLRAEATITRNDDGGLHLRLLVRSGSLAGERNMDGKSCSALAGAAAVTLVLLLHSSEPLTENDLAGTSNTAPAGGQSKSDASTNGAASNPAATDRSATRQDPIRATPSAPTPPDQHPSRPAPGPDARPERRWHVLLQLPQVELGLGPLHQPSVGLAIAAGAALDRWRFLAKGSLWFSQHATASNADQQYGADIDRQAITLLTCRGVPLSSGFELSPCLSLAVQHLSARGTGVHVGPQTGTATWFAIGAGAQGRVNVAPWLRLVLGLDAQLQVAQPSLSVDEIGPVERLLPVALLTTLGPEWIF